MWTFLAVSLSHNDEGCAYSNELISFCLMTLLLAKSAVLSAAAEGPKSDTGPCKGGSPLPHVPTHLLIFVAYI